jgi:hypothetical protein
MRRDYGHGPYPDYLVGDIAVVLIQPASCPMQRTVNQTQTVKRVRASLSIETAFGES